MCPLATKPYIIMRVAWVAKPSAATLAKKFQFEGRLSAEWSFDTPSWHVFVACLFVVHAFGGDISFPFYIILICNHVKERFAAKALQNQAQYEPFLPVLLSGCSLYCGCKDTTLRKRCQEFPFIFLLVHRANVTMHLPLNSCRFLVVYGTKKLDNEPCSSSIVQ